MNQINSEGDESGIRDEVRIIIPLHSPSRPNIQMYRRSPVKSTTSAIFCRICHDVESQESLISPCNCKGTMMLVHKSCLEKWLNVSKTDYCDLCKYKFSLITKSPPISQWLLSDEGPRRTVCWDAMSLLVLTTLCAISVYLFFVGAKSFLVTGIWTGIGLIVFITFIIVTCVLGIYCTIRQHHEGLRLWQETHQEDALSLRNTEGPAADSLNRAHPQLSSL